MPGFRPLWILIALLASLAPAWAPAAGQFAEDPVYGPATAVLDSLRAADGFPGGTAAYVLPDGEVRTLATGWADREDSVSMTPQTRMLSGSTGKSFAAAVVLSLAEEGRLDLDGPVSRWLGDRPWFDRLPNGDALTLRHLLRHRSGLRDHIHDPDFAEAMQVRMREEGRDAALPPEALMRFVLGDEPLFPAGQGYHYSDTNYILAGLVIEAATDSAYYVLLRRRLLDPLGLTRTAPADRRDPPGLAAGYIRGETLFPVPSKVTEDGVLVYNPATEWTGGGLVTNSRDLARWAKLLCEGRALPGAYLSELLRAVPKDKPQQARFGADVAYGLGVTLRSTSLGRAWGHRGWTPGYLSVFEYYPGHRIAVALQVNEEGPHNMAAYAERLARAVAAALEP